MVPDFSTVVRLPKIQHPTFAKMTVHSALEVTTWTTKYDKGFFQLQLFYYSGNLDASSTRRAICLKYYHAYISLSHTLSCFVWCPL